MTHNQVKRGRDFTGMHDSYCRCKSCKPPHPTDTNWTPTIATLIGLGLLVLAILVTM